MLVVLPVWMVMLGLVRRLTPGGGNITFSGDPVLIIGPIIIILLFLPPSGGAPSSAGPGSPRSSRRSACIALLEAFNPQQAACSRGSAACSSSSCRCSRSGSVARSLDKALALQIVRTVAVLSLFAAIYGLSSSSRACRRGTRRWITTKGYAALSLGSNVIRAFGSFSSAEEYAAFLSIGLVAWLALA